MEHVEGREVSYVASCVLGVLLFAGNGGMGRFYERMDCWMKHRLFAHLVAKTCYPHFRPPQSGTTATYTGSGYISWCLKEVKVVMVVVVERQKNTPGAVEAATAATLYERSVLRSFSKTQSYEASAMSVA